ncbi:MAG: hypothetical protein GF364_15920 [Candidatus Lokiarchaeota archaeon]|nr:hypothetical protein [Candidatus Lokiarchaeota archaeon]
MDEIKESTGGDNKEGKQNSSLDESFFKKSKAIKRSINRFWGLTLKELKILVTDKTAMLIAFALPITVIILLATQGQALIEDLESTDRGSPPSDPPILGVMDVDNSALSEEFMALIADYELNEFCTLVYPEDTSSYEAGKNELLDLLGINEIHAILIIPPLFGFNLTTHFPAILEVVFDTIDTTHLQTAQEVIDKMVEEFKLEKGFTGVFQADFQSEGVPEKGKLLFLASPLFFPMILFSIGSLTATQSIVSDIPKDRMVLTPTNKYEMLAAKTTALQIIMSILIVITVSLSMIFGLTIRGSILGYFWMLFFIALSGVVWGMFVSALADVPLNAFQYFIFMFLFQVILIIFVESGFVLRLIPIYNGRLLLLNVTLRGEPLLWNIQYLSDTIIETVVLYLITQWLFNRKKAML